MHCRDKDAVVTSMLVAELMAVCMEKGTTLFEYMENIYNKYGRYVTETVAKKYPGIEGAAEMKEIMDNARNKVRSEIAGIKVEEIIDYQLKIKKDLINNTEEETTLPKSNVIFYNLEDGSFICIRPSGTEPLIKYYFDVKADTLEEAKNKLKIFQKEYL